MEQGRKRHLLRGDPGGIYVRPGTVLYVLYVRISRVVPRTAGIGNLLE